MDLTDVVDEVNSLLKLGVGDPYRLEHIKQTFIQNKKIWITDENYLKRLREKYLEKQNSDASADIVFENEPKEKETIHCWKCGKQVPLSANFCMICGTSLFEVGAEPQPIPESKPSVKVSKSIPLKFPIIIGIPIVILIILGVGYSQGYFDSTFDRTSDELISAEIEHEIFYGEFDSKCGAGTVLDPETNACRVGEIKPTSSGDTDSKCGPGTVFDAKSNSCILE